MKYFLQNLRNYKKTHNKTITKVYDGEKTYIIKEFNTDKREIYKTLMQKQLPGIPTICSVELEDSTIVTEEFIEGDTLYDIINKGKQLTVKEASRIALSVARTISNLHGVEIIHRDIKPSNIVISKDWNAYIVDFDIARIYKPYSEKDTHLFGTEGYAPPEQFGFSSTDFKSDIYSYGKTMKDLFYYIKKPGKYKRIFEKCIEFDPKKRYSDIKKVIFHIRMCNLLHSRKLLGITAALLLVNSILLFSVITPYMHNQSPSLGKEKTKHAFAETLEKHNNATKKTFSPATKSDLLNQKSAPSVGDKIPQNQNSLPNAISNITSKNKTEKQDLFSSSPSSSYKGVDASSLETVNTGNDTEEYTDFTPPFTTQTCFYCDNPPTTFFGDRRYCSEHTPKCTKCGKPISSGQNGVCESCVLSSLE